jgi:hypothetical protein
VSNQVNTDLFERAAEMIDEFEGKLPAQLIEQDLERNDLISLYNHVNQAEAEMSRQEFETNDCY